MALEKPPSTLGEDQFESSSLFLENAFLQWEILVKINKNQQINFQLISISEPHSLLEISKQQHNAARQLYGRYRQVVRTVRIGCTDLDFCAENQLPRFLCKNKSAFYCLFSKICLLLLVLSVVCLFFLLFWFAEELPSMCAKLLPLSPSCPEISLTLLLSFSQSAHERMNDFFLL